MCRTDRNLAVVFIMYHQHGYPYIFPGFLRTKFFKRLTVCFLNVVCDNSSCFFRAVNDEGEVFDDIRGDAGRADGYDLFHLQPALNSIERSCSSHGVADNRMHVTVMVCQRSERLSEMNEVGIFSRRGIMSRRVKCHYLV